LRSKPSFPPSLLVFAKTFIVSIRFPPHCVPDG
jgi:hypothetical protein